jgi:hypothetical protein
MLFLDGAPVMDTRPQLAQVCLVEMLNSGIYTVEARGTPPNPSE